MAPRTRNKQRKERRKWMRDQHRLQQQNHQGPDISGDRIPSHNVSSTTECPRLETTDDPAVGDESQGEGMTLFDGSKFGELVLDDGDNNNHDQNTNHNKNGQEQLHPPDCLCILRKQSRDKEFFLPTMFLSSTMKQSDSYYCLEISSNDISNARK